MASDCPAHTAAEATVHAVPNDAGAAELRLLHQRFVGHSGADYSAARWRGLGVRGSRKPNGRGRKHSNHRRTHRISLSFQVCWLTRIVHLMRREPSTAAGDFASVTTHASADAPPHDAVHRIYQAGYTCTHIFTLSGFA